MNEYEMTNFVTVIRYLNNYVDNIFSGAWDPIDVTPLPVEIPLPSTANSMKISTFQTEITNNYSLVWSLTRFSCQMFATAGQS